MRLLKFLWLCGLISMVVMMVYFSFVEFAKENKKERTKYEQCYKLAPKNQE